MFIDLLLLIACCLLFYLYWKEKQRKDTIEEKNKEIENINKQMEEYNRQLDEEQKKVMDEIRGRKKELNEIHETISNATEISRKAFENYNDVLDTEYVLKEKEFNESVELLNESYNRIQTEKLAEIGQITAELDKMASTRAAAIQAQLKEKEIEEQQEFYSLIIDDIDKREVRVLQSIEPELRDPRPIRMIIWTAYYTKKANDLAARILGPDEKCGIYKITNKINGLCYIGQAKKIRERWRDHMKCGLGIDTPVNNKLYEAMKKEGLENFTFELLEECAAADLNEKEAFYINLYSSKDYGYNSTIGNKK